MRIILLVALIAVTYTIINSIIINADAVRVWNRTLPCTWSTNSTSFSTVNCSGVSMSLSYTCNSSTSCGAFADTSYEHFIGYGGLFYTELRVDGSTRAKGFTQCVGVGGSSCALDDRMSALSIAEVVDANDTDTFTLVGRVGSTAYTGYIYTAVLNLIV
jgi:hypothetical protein